MKSDWSNSPPNERTEKPKFQWNQKQNHKGVLAFLALAFGSLLALVGLSQK